MNDWKMELYWRLPVRLQEAALSLYARYLEKMYYGDEFEKWRDWLKDWKDWSPSSVEGWKNERLQHVIRIAAEHVPFYRSTFGGIDWKRVRSESDLPLLPLLEKQSIRQNEGAFIADNVLREALWKQKTSGTTGTSLRIFWPKAMTQQLWAIDEVVVRGVAGVSQQMPRAMMGGRPVLPGDTGRPPYWRFNRRWRQLYFSSYHISTKTAPHYVRALEAYGSEWLTGYGSAIAALADSAVKCGMAAHPLKAVIVSGDTLLDEMRHSIETFFRCRCFDQYGQSEGVAVAMECDHGQMHVIPQVGIIEILRDDGSPCEPGEVGQIVATGLLNDAMPLIRYRIGDYAAWKRQGGCPCGNRNPVLTHLEGRTDDYLITSDGRKIGRLSTAMKRSPTIHSAQLVQDRPGHAFFLVRPGAGYSSSDARTVCDDIRERIGSFRLEVVEVPEIPKTPQGKTVLVVRLEERPGMGAVYERILRVKNVS
jgi:phenylacetate-CoA ligase